MKILVGDISSGIESKDPRVLGIIKSVCRARPSGYRFMRKYKSGVWDGYISLMDSWSKFPTGLLGFVVGELQRRGYNVELEWVDGKPGLEDYTLPDLAGITLRDYQEEAAHALLKAGRGIAKMATNAGKTEIIAAMIGAIGEPCLVLVHRKELLYQTANRIGMRLGIDVGCIGDGVQVKREVTVGMIQTISKMVHLPTRFDTNVGLFIDECHHGSSEQYLKTVKKIPGRMRYGFSGTPLSRGILADMRLISITGRQLVEVTNEQLIGEGYSAKPEIHMHTIYVDGGEAWRADYHDAYEHYIVRNEERNRAVAKLAKKGRTTLVIVNRIVHGHMLKELLPGSLFVNGGDSADYRNSVLEMMRSRPGVYIATNIFDEGVDVPDIDTLILAAGGKAEGTLLQRIGRGLRQKEGANKLTVHDFIDDSNKHLLKHSKERVDVYVSENFSIISEDEAPAG